MTKQILIQCKEKKKKKKEKEKLSTPKVLCKAWNLINVTTSMKAAELRGGFHWKDMTHIRVCVESTYLEK